MHWLEFAVRWLHVITAIVWIGSSFYFIALDLGLRSNKNLPFGVHGEEWQVHGGGFYHIQKYMVAPEKLPEHLTWFKWESYFTWVSGFALLAIVYYGGADLYLINHEKLELPKFWAIIISLSSIFGFWIFYNYLCKSKIGENSNFLMLFLFLILVFLSWGFHQVFTGRAAFLHLGAITATVMSANVFLIIIPNQKVVVENLKSGKKPDAIYGKIAKQRSTHNNYLTLPVIFLMISNHYPLAFATDYSWIIASLVFLMGVTIRHYFNVLHSKNENLIWTWLLTILIFLIIIFISLLPQYINKENVDAVGSKLEQKVSIDFLSDHKNKLLTHSSFDQVSEIIMDRCSMCHAKEPIWENMIVAPGNVNLETKEEILFHAENIFIYSFLSHAMPPGNITYMEKEERNIIADWYKLKNIN